jgi:hypothetical protein
MKKTFKILFMLMLIANIGFGQAKKVPNIKLSFTQLKEIRTLLGNTNSIAFYAEKKGANTKLSYAIYDATTLEVSNFNGKPISNDDFLKLFEKMKLNKKIKFSASNFGSTGTYRDPNKLESHKIIKFYNFMTEQLSPIEQIENFLFVYHENFKLKYKIAKSINGKPIKGGGGVGGDGAVAPAPPVKR